MYSLLLTAFFNFTEFKIQINEMPTLKMNVQRNDCFWTFHLTLKIKNINK
jgi:hypothetical protein